MAAALIHAVIRTDITSQVRHFVDHANTNTKTDVVQNIVIRVQNKYCSQNGISPTSTCLRFFKFLSSFTAVVTLPSGVA